MGQRPRRVVDLDADLVRRVDAQVLGQARVRLLQRLQRVRREQRVLSRPGAKREVRALEDLVPLGLLRRRLGQSGIAFQRALVQPTLGGVRIRFRRLGILLLVGKLIAAGDRLIRLALRAADDALPVIEQLLELRDRRAAGVLQSDGLLVCTRFRPFHQLAVRSWSGWRRSWSG